MSKRTHADALQTKKRILEAAGKIFAVHGFSKSSLSDIAREANVTRGAIYWHFENKNELLAALLEEKAHQFDLVNSIREASDDNQRDPLGTLKKWILRHFTDDVEQELLQSSIMEILESVMFSTEHEDAKKKLLELIYERKFRIEEALRAAIGRSQLPVDLDIELAASFLQSLLWGLTHNIRIGMSVKPVTNYALVIEAAFIALPTIRKGQSLSSNLAGNYNSLRSYTRPSYY